tara:strand:+ start:86 stop:331 length:246 start_codon:yes stop_codon:yes gene_type:complete
MKEKKKLEKILNRVQSSVDRAIKAKEAVDESDVDDDNKEFLYTITEKALSYSLDVCFGTDDDFDAVHTYNSWIESELNNIW